MEAKYIAACEAAKESVWLKKFYTDLGSSKHGKTTCFIL